MHVGMLTAPLSKQPFEYVVKFAAEVGIRALEVASGPGSLHIDTAAFSQADVEPTKALLDANNVCISSLGMYGANVTHADPDKRAESIANVLRAVEVAQMLGVDVICMTSGMPVPGKTKVQTIKEDCRESFPKILDAAGEAGVKIALENWFATNIQGLMQWEVLFETLPQCNLGLNFDPSHLIWQGIDYIGAVHAFKDRIFHTHAKDTEIRQDKLRWIGSLEGGWWRYVIPGFGAISWGEYISALRAIGYDGVLSIEHEDNTFAPEEGFIAGSKYLSLFV